MPCLSHCGVPDNNKVLNYEEFTSLLFGYNPVLEPQARELFSLIDMDGDGSIDYGEFLLLIDDPEKMKRDIYGKIENMFEADASGCSFELGIAVILFVLGLYYTPIICDKQMVLQQEIIKYPLFNNLSTTKLLALHKTNKDTSEGGNSNNL